MYKVYNINIFLILLPYLFLLCISEMLTAENYVCRYVTECLPGKLYYTREIHKKYKM